LSAPFHSALKQALRGERRRLRGGGRRLLNLPCLVWSAAFEAMQQNGQIAKFEVTGNQVILYLRELSNERAFELTKGFLGTSAL
jgi:hypothetical protein